MIGANDCPVGIFLPFMYGTAGFSIFLSLAALYFCHRARLRLNGIRSVMPFRTQSLLLLRNFVRAAIVVQAYFLFSAALQIAYGRPICIVNGAQLPYILAWLDWMAIFFFSIWPAVLLLILLFNVWQEATRRPDVHIAPPGERIEEGDSKEW